MKRFKAFIEETDATTHRNKMVDKLKKSGSLKNDEDKSEKKPYKSPMDVYREKMKQHESAEELDEFKLSDLAGKATGTKNVRKVMKVDKIKKEIEDMKARLAKEETNIGDLKTHDKWNSGRYNKMKLGGLQHKQIEKVWDDEVEAEKIAMQMKKNNSAGKK